MKPSLPFRHYVELGMDQQAVQMRIADDLLFDRVAAFAVVIGDLKSKADRTEALDFRSHVAPLVVEEGLPVAYQILQVA